MAGCLVEYSDGRSEIVPGVDKHFFSAWKRNRTATMYDNGKWWYSQKGQKRNLEPKGAVPVRKIKTVDVVRLTWPAEAALEADDGRLTQQEVSHPERQK